jgi:23S rRNA pseudouridine1911/1915/1917 synthase
MARKTLVVEAPQSGQRLDLFVGQALGLSRAKLKSLFEEGGVRVDGRKAKKGQLIASSQTVEVDWEEQSVTPVASSDVALTVLYEDEALVAVDKPAGAPAHPLRPGETGTVVNALVARYPECAQASLDEREGGLCHRLDVETSGVLLAARTREAWSKMREAFSGREIDKRYVALVSGPLVDEGEIDLPLRHDARHSEKMEAAVDETDGARAAHSLFKVLARRGEWSLVEVKIITGVHHQIRAHLAAIGAPIAQDPTYGGREVPELKRFFLHARSLGFTHPLTGKNIQVESPLAPELVSVLTGLGFET